MAPHENVCSNRLTFQTEIKEKDTGKKQIHTTTQIRTAGQKRDN